MERVGFKTFFGRIGFHHLDYRYFYLADLICRSGLRDSKLTIRNLNFMDTLRTSSAR